jgi:hypothetical protein
MSERAASGWTGFIKAGFALRLVLVAGFFAADFLGVGIATWLLHRSAMVCRIFRALFLRFFTDSKNAAKPTFRVASATTFPSATAQFSSRHFRGEN